MAHVLDPYLPVCDAIALLLRPHAEVVLHDLATGRIRYLANAFSRRRAGDPSLVEAGADFGAGAPVIGPYPKHNWDGRRLKSVTAVLRDGRRRPVGLLCINQDIEALAGALDQLQQLVELPAQPATAALVASDWRESINGAVGAFLAERGTTLAGLAASERDQLIAALDAQGIFEIRRAVPYVAATLHLSRATIYGRLAALRRRAPRARPGRR